MSLATETPSLVMVGAPHFFSSTTLRPLGPRVTATASASWFMPDSRARRACSSKAMILGIRVLLEIELRGCDALRGVSTLGQRLLTANHLRRRLATATREC